MKAKELTQKEKDDIINKLKEVFTDVRSFLNTIEEDWSSEDLVCQSSALWIAAQFCEGYSGFVNSIKNLDQKKCDLDNLKEEIQSTQVLG